MKIESAVTNQKRGGRARGGGDDVTGQTAGGGTCCRRRSSSRNYLTAARGPARPLHSLLCAVYRLLLRSLCSQRFIIFQTIDRFVERRCKYDPDSIRCRLRISVKLNTFSIRVLTFNAIIYKKKKIAFIIFFQNVAILKIACVRYFSLCSESVGRGIYVACTNTRLHFGQRLCVIDNCFRIMKTCFNVIYWIVKDKGERSKKRAGRGAGGGNAFT